MTLSGVTLVTGAGRGLGAAIARALAAEGMAVGLLGRERAGLAAVAKDCPRSAVVSADVTDASAVRRAVAEVAAALGPVDLLVNNAGRIDPTEVGFAVADPDELWSVVETNLRGPLLVTAAVLPGMLHRGGGRIVNLNSGFAYRRTSAYTGYAVSKAALARFTDLLAFQYADAGVRVFDVSPGAVATDMTAGMPMFAGKRDWNPVERLTAAVVAVAEGRLDGLSGRFLHVGHDDLDRLVARAAEIRRRDARVLRLVPYGEDDPLG
jgi:NAD(P)-dependent dehydrogenase (short-subunit alcohol dehydrogenase family)